MRTPITFVAAVLFGAAMAAAPADASCKRFGFTVNDYGKDGPTKDAKELLDKHISEWAAQQGIKDYKTGPKSVNCELFLNFVVFDEHTCTASANVCWNDGKGKSTPETAAISPEDGEAVPPTPIRKAALLAHDKKATAAAAAAATQAPAAATEAAPVSTPAEEATTPPATPASVTTETTAPAATPPPAEPAKAAEAAPTPPPAIETGTLPKDPLSALKKHAAVDPAPAAPTLPAATVPKNDPAAASAAATAAAAAAERAAVAAETAANAAKEAAAAAVAASAASKGSVVPPGDGTP
jgi:hypothetical protein